MSSRIISLIALGAALIVPLGVGAQTPPASAPAASATGNAASSTGRHGGHHRESLLHALRAVNLTAAQRAAVKNFREARNAADANADSATKRTNAIKFRQQIMGILTSDQKAQLRAARHRSSVAPGANGEPAAPPAPGSR
jgi:Spy/CpxP family protein refolding chaperone